MAETAIEWATHSWNPVTGCDRVSPGCAHCYALDLAARLKGMGQARYQRDGDPRTSGPGFGVTLHPDKLKEPLKWRKPRRVFVNSMSDLFHEEIPDDFIHQVFQIMERAEQHTFQVLTKRPERARDLLRHLYSCSWCDGREDCVACEDRGARAHDPLPNVWLGASIENRRFVHRADVLRDTPAAVRFISAEPLLGPLIYDTDIGMYNDKPEGPYRKGDIYTPCWLDQYEGPELDLTGIDWLIVGGESGDEHRPMRAEWACDLRDACMGFDPDYLGRRPAFFFKQWGGARPKSGGRELDGRMWDEFPGPRTAPVAA